MLGLKRRDLVYPNFHLPYRGLPAEVRVKIWQLVLHKTVLVLPQPRTSGLHHRIGPNDFVKSFDDQRQYALLDFKDTALMATRLPQLNKELHHEIKSSLKDSLILDVRYLTAHSINAFTITPVIRHRMRGFTIVHGPPQVRSSWQTQPDFPPYDMEQISALLDLLERITSGLTQPLQYFVMRTQLDMLPQPLRTMACTYVGHTVESEFSRNDMLAALQLFSPEFKDYCALMWIPGLWKSLLHLLSEGRLREVALCCGSTQGFFGDLVRAHGVKHVFGVNLGDYGLVGRLRVQVEVNEGDAVDKFGRKEWNKETIVRLRV